MQRPSTTFALGIILAFSLLIFCPQCLQKGNAYSLSVYLWEEKAIREPVLCPFVPSRPLSFPSPPKKEVAAAALVFWLSQKGPCDETILPPNHWKDVPKDFHVHHPLVIVSEVPAWVICPHTAHPRRLLSQQSMLFPMAKSQSWMAS